MERRGEDTNLLLLAEGAAVVCFVPLTERCRVNLDDGVLDEGVRSHQLVVGRVVDDVDDTCLLCHGFRSPGEIAGI